MAEERKRVLAQRFSKRGEKHEQQAQESTKPKVARSRHSLYLDKAIVDRMDKAYKDTAHTLYPVELDKAEFMEALLAYGLDHLDAIAVLLVEQAK